MTHESINVLFYRHSQVFSRHGLVLQSRQQQNSTRRFYDTDLVGRHHRDRQRRTKQMIY